MLGTSSLAGKLTASSDLDNRSVCSSACSSRKNAELIAAAFSVQQQQHCHSIHNDDDEAEEEDDDEYDAVHDVSSSSTSLAASEQNINKNGSFSSESTRNISNYKNLSSQNFDNNNENSQDTDNDEDDLISLTSGSSDSTIGSEHFSIATIENEQEDMAESKHYQINVGFNSLKLIGHLIYIVFN